MNARRDPSVRAVTMLMFIASASCGDGEVVRAPTAVAVTSHVLRVQGDGGGWGMVTAPDASPGISCAIAGGALAGVCAGVYPGHSTVRLIAVPNAGSTFVGWSGACTDTDQCVVEMSNERTVTARFTR